MVVTQVRTPDRPTAIQMTTVALWAVPIATLRTKTIALGTRPAQDQCESEVWHAWCTGAE
jgi:hypothetical protein